MIPPRGKGRPRRTALTGSTTFAVTLHNLIDTADVYSRWVPGSHGGESEAIIGKWLRQSGRRQQVVIATKVGMEMAPDKKGLSRAHILRSVEDFIKTVAD